MAFFPERGGTASSPLIGAALRRIRREESLGETVIGREMPGIGERTDSPLAADF
jgi:hypothetical protein